MKKFFKTIRNHMGKQLLKILIRFKLFDVLPFFVGIFPKSRHKAMHSLMHRGYLNLAYDILASNTQEIKEFEKDLIEKISFMHRIKKEGLHLDKASSKPIINTIHPLFVVHNSLPYDKAGYAIRTHSIVTHLKNFISLEVVTRAGYPWDLQKHRAQPFSPNDMIDGVEYIRLSDKEKTFKKGSDLNYIDVYAQEIIKVARAKRSTILHASSNYLNGLAAIKAGRELHVPVVYEIRGLWYITRTTLDEKFKKQGLYDYEHQMEKACALYADKVVVISEALKELIVSWGIDKEKITVIPNAVDIKKFQPLTKDRALVQQYGLEGKFVVGFIGSITGYEGLKELVIGVRNLVKNGYDDIVLMIVGEGRELKKLKKLAQRSKNIIFTGRVPFEDVTRYYSVFDVCPFPRNDYEVCQYIPPLKPLEAMAMQKAIIVSDVAPLLEIVEENKTAIVCNSNSVDSLKDAIIKFYDNKKLRDKIAQNAKIWVEKNRNWNFISKKYMEIYNGFL